MSRLHAVLERVAGGWTLCGDGLSRNGSFVNGERVSGRRVLADGDAITVGRTPLVYRELAGELFLGVDTVKSRLRELFRSFGVPDLPQNRKRAELVRRAHELGLVRRR